MNNLMEVVQPIIYRPDEFREKELQYPRLIRDIYFEGERRFAQWQKTESGEPEEFRYLTGQLMDFDLSNGVPFTTLRDLKGAVESAINELRAFLGGAVTIEEYESYGANPNWWKASLTAEKCAVFGLKEGEFGKGGYGSALTQRIKNGKVFNQVKVLLQQMKDFPNATTHLLVTWYPEYDLGTKEEPREVATAPCHGTTVYFDINMETGTLAVIHVQRAADGPVGLVFNILQYIVLGMMIAHLLGLTFTRYKHFILNAHIYGVQFEAVKKILERAPRVPPVLILKRRVTDISDFRANDFELQKYNPWPALFIKTPF